MIAWLLLLVALGVGLWSADRWISIRSIATKVGDGEWAARSGWHMLGVPEIWVIFFFVGMLIGSIIGIVVWAGLDWSAQKVAKLAYRKRLQKLDEDEKALSDRKKEVEELATKARRQIHQASIDVQIAQEEAANAIKEAQRQANLDVHNAQLVREGAELELARERKRKMNAMGKAQRLHRQKQRNQARM